jgi:hypothetical protein
VVRTPLQAAAARLRTGQASGMPMGERAVPVHVIRRVRGQGLRRCGAGWFRALPGPSDYAAATGWLLITWTLSSWISAAGTRDGR